MIIEESMLMMFCGVKVLVHAFHLISTEEKQSVIMIFFDMLTVFSVLACRQGVVLPNNGFIVSPFGMYV